MISMMKGWDHNGLCTSKSVWSTVQACACELYSCVENVTV